MGAKYGNAVPELAKETISQMALANAASGLQIARTVVSPDLNITGKCVW